MQPTVFLPPIIHNTLLDSNHLPHSTIHPPTCPPSSPCWLGPSVAPAWNAARRRSSCHCCAACAGRPPAWWGAARPEIRPGPPPCTPPGPPMGWAVEECGSLRAPGTEQCGSQGGERQRKGGKERGFIHHFLICCVTAASTISRTFPAHCHIVFLSWASCWAPVSLSALWNRGHRHRPLMRRSR